MKSLTPLGTVIALCAALPGTATARCELGTIVPADALPGDQFGTSMSLAGDMVVIGAFLDHDPLPAMGSAYVFERSAGDWHETAELRPSDGTQADDFGYAVALDAGGQRALVGSPHEDIVGFDSGAVYAFERQGSGWLETYKLTAETPREFAFFGRSIAADGQLALFGAPGENPVELDAGAAYLFEHGDSGWTQTAQLCASDPTEEAYFGVAVALEGDEALVGAPLGDLTAEDAGTVYRFSAGGWPVQDYCTGAPNSAGGGAALSFEGSPSVSANDFTLLVTGGVPGQPGLFFHGPNASQVPFGDGFLCVAGGGLGLGSPPADAGPGAIEAGSSWNFQFWYRDPAAGGSGHNLSDALSAAFCP